MILRKVKPWPSMDQKAYKKRFAFFPVDTKEGYVIWLQFYYKIYSYYNQYPWGWSHEYNTAILSNKNPIPPRKSFK